MSAVAKSLPAPVRAWVLGRRPAHDTMTPEQRADYEQLLELYERTGLSDVHYHDICTDEATAAEWGEARVGNFAIELPVNKPLGDMPCNFGMSIQPSAAKPERHLKLAVADMGQQPEPIEVLNGLILEVKRDAMSIDIRLSAQETKDDSHTHPDV